MMPALPLRPAVRQPPTHAGPPGFRIGGRACGHYGTNCVKRWPACIQSVPRAVALAGTWHYRVGFELGPLLGGSKAVVQGTRAGVRGLGRTRRFSLSVSEPV